MFGLRLLNVWVIYEVNSSLCIIYLGGVNSLFPGSGLGELNRKRAVTSFFFLILLVGFIQENKKRKDLSPCYSMGSLKFIL